MTRVIDIEIEAEQVSLSKAKEKFRDRERGKRNTYRLHGGILNAKRAQERKNDLLKATELLKSINRLKHQFRREGSINSTEISGLRGRLHLICHGMKG